MRDFKQYKPLTGNFIRAVYCVYCSAGLFLVNIFVFLLIIYYIRDIYYAKYYDKGGGVVKKIKIRIRSPAYLQVPYVTEPVHAGEQGGTHRHLRRDEAPLAGRGETGRQNNIYEWLSESKFFAQ